MFNDAALFLLSHYFEIMIILTTAFGAAGMYIFSDYKGFDNSKSFLKAQFPRRKSSFYSRMDFILVVFSGTVIGLICFSPASYVEALAAGFGWTGSMNVLMKTAAQKEEA